jgi:hypothetical protein
MEGYRVGVFENKELKRIIETIRGNRRLKTAA